MAAPDTAQATARVPWMSREGRFRFELGLRQGSDDFFKPSSQCAAILAARKSVLEKHPERHVAMREDGADLLREVRSFAQQAGGIALSSRGSIHEDCVELGKAWEPDFLLLKPATDGVHQLAGGCVCFPSSWDLHEKLGLPVESIHAPVPTLNENLGTQISAFLRRIKPGVVWERWNWGVAAVDVQNHHPALALPKLHAGSTLADSWLRIEHQAFRSLDAHGGLLFAIRISVLSLAEIAQQREAALRLAELFETMPDDIATYKGLLTARIHLSRLLRETA